MIELEAFLSGTTLLSGFAPVFQLGCAVNVALSVWKTKYISIKDKILDIEETFESKLTQLELNIQDIKDAGLLTVFPLVKFIVKSLNYILGVIGKYIAMVTVVFSGGALVYSSFKMQLMVSNSTLLFLSFTVLLLPLLIYYAFIGFSKLSENIYDGYCEQQICKFNKLKNVFTKTPQTPSPPTNI